MGWVKLDDAFSMHPKVVRVSLEARWAYIEALCWSARYETDGEVPNAVAANGSVREELIAVGLWERLENSVSIHDFLLYNPSRIDREQNRNRMRTVRAQNTNVGRTKQKTSGTGRGSGVGLVLEGGRGGEPSFADFWAAYPRKVGKPKAAAAFDQAARRADAADIVAGAERYAADPNRTPTFTAHPTTWLNRDGWEDDPLPARDASGEMSQIADELRRQGL